MRPNSFLNNTNNAKRWVISRALKRLDQPVDRERWGSMDPTQVSPSLSRIPPRSPLLPCIVPCVEWSRLLSLLYIQVHLSLVSPGVSIFCISRCSGSVRLRSRPSARALQVDGGSGSPRLALTHIHLWCSGGWELRAAGERSVRPGGASPGAFLLFQIP